MPPLAEVHTLNIARKISQMEVARIQRKYHLADDEAIKVTDTGIVGINEISIAKNPVFKDGTFTGHSYTLNILVNVAKVIGRSRVLPFGGDDGQVGIAPLGVQAEYRVGLLLLCKERIYSNLRRLSSSFNRLFSSFSCSSSTS